MIIIDSLPIYEDLDKRDNRTEALHHFKKVLDIINSFGIGLSFKQALLLLDYENEAYKKVLDLYCKVQPQTKDLPDIKQFRTINLTNTFKNFNEEYKKARTLQKELRIIDSIREANKSLLTGGCNCE